LPPKVQTQIIAMNYLVKSLFLILLTSEKPSNAYEIIFSVNAGDIKSTDSNGIPYQKDNNQAGGVISCAEPATLKEVPFGEELLYRNVRFANFGYNILTTGDGHYTVIMKFSECWQQKENIRVFDVYLNQRKIICHIDIVKKVGFRTVLTEHIYFSVCQDKLHYGNEEIQLFNRNVRIDFVSVKDNAILNAMVVVKKTSIENLPNSLLATTVTRKPPNFYDCQSNQSSLSQSERHTKIEGFTINLHIHNPTFIVNTTSGNSNKKKIEGDTGKVDEQMLELF
jgi:hypothetical protein